MTVTLTLTLTLTLIQALTPYVNVTSTLILTLTIGARTQLDRGHTLLYRTVR